MNRLVEQIMSNLKKITESEEIEYQVFESKYYYSSYKDILFVGKYEDAVRFIQLNSQLTLEMLPTTKIVKPEIEEGVTIDNDEYKFNFNKDEKSDIITLRYNKDLTFSKTSNGTILLFSYKINKNIDKNERIKFLTYLKNKSIDNDLYEKLLSKAMIGLFNNSSLNISDTDLILIPESSSSVNYDIATKIRNKVPNALFLKEVILKNEPENVTINYELLNEKGYKPENITQLEKMVLRATIDGVFKIKKIHPRFRKFVINFLKIDTTNQHLLNKILDGKVIIVDDYISEGTTLKEISRLVENYAPKEIILYSLIG